MDGDDEQAKHYRQRAEEVLAIAADLEDLKAKEILLQVAMDYLEMAARIEESQGPPADGTSD